MTSGAVGCRRLVELVNGVKVRLPADVVGQVGCLAIQGSQTQDIVRRHHHLCLYVALHVQQNDDRLACCDRFPATLRCQRLATLAILLKVRGTRSPASVGGECQGDPLRGALHLTMKTG